MQTRPQNFITFNAISLNKDETKRSEDLLRSLNNPAKKERAKLELFDIFDKHLQKEAEEKAGKLYYQEDFLQKLYLTFLESLENIKSLTTDNLLKILNDTKPDKEDRKESYLFEKFSKKQIDDRAVESNLSEEVLEQLSYGPENHTEELKNVRYLLEDLSTKEKDLLFEHAGGKSYGKIANDTKVSNTNIRLTIKSAMAKIQLHNNKLPEEYELFAEKFIKTLNLDLNKDEAINFLIKNIELLDYDINHLSNNVETTSKLLEIDKKLYAEAALKQNQLFILKPETIFDNIDNTSKLLDIDRKSVTKAALKQPSLFYLKPKTVFENIDNTSKLLELDKKLFTKVALKQPALFVQKPETIFDNIDKTSKLLDIDRKLYIEAALRQPSLFCRKPEGIFGNIDKTSGLLNIDRKLVTEASLKLPSLFYIKPETILNNVDKVSKLLKIDRKSFTESALKLPPLFVLKPENIAKKVNIIKYYKEIQGKDNSQIVFSTLSDKRLYYNILAYLIKEHDGLKKVLKENELVIYLKSQNKNYNFSIPQNELADEFIKYAHDFSKSNLLKQVFNIIKSAKAY